MKIFLISITGCIALFLIEAKHSVAANSSINPIKYEEKTLSDCNPQNCHYGKCVRGNCVCYEGWTGTGCQHCTGKVRWEIYKIDIFIYMILSRDGLIICR